MFLEISFCLLFLFASIAIWVSYAWFGSEQIGLYRFIVKPPPWLKDDESIRKNKLQEKKDYNNE